MGRARTRKTRTRSPALDTSSGEDLEQESASRRSARGAAPKKGPVKKQNKTKPQLKTRTSQRRKKQAPNEEFEKEEGEDAKESSNNSEEEEKSEVSEGQETTLRRSSRRRGKRQKEEAQEGQKEEAQEGEASKEDDDDEEEEAESENADEKSGGDVEPVAADQKQADEHAARTSQRRSTRRTPGGESEDAKDEEGGNADDGDVEDELRDESERSHSSRRGVKRNLSDDEDDEQTHDASERSKKTTRRVGKDKEGMDVTSDEGASHDEDKPDGQKRGAKKRRSFASVTDKPDHDETGKLQLRRLRRNSMTTRSDPPRQFGETVVSAHPSSDRESQDDESITQQQNQQTGDFQALPDVRLEDSSAKDEPTGSGDLDKLVDERVESTAGVVSSRGTTEESPGKDVSTAEAETDELENLASRERGERSSNTEIDAVKVACTEAGTSGVHTAENDSVAPEGPVDTTNRSPKRGDDDVDSKAGELHSIPSQSALEASKSEGGSVKSDDPTPEHVENEKMAEALMLFSSTATAQALEHSENVTIAAIAGKGALEPSVAAIADKGALEPSENVTVAAIADKGEGVRVEESGSKSWDLQEDRGAFSETVGRSESVVPSEDGGPLETEHNVATESQQKGGVVVEFSKPLHESDGSAESIGICTDDQVPMADPSLGSADAAKPVLSMESSVDPEASPSTPSRQIVRDGQDEETAAATSPSDEEGHLSGVGVVGEPGISPSEEPEPEDERPAVSAFRWMLEDDCLADRKPVNEHHSASPTTKPRLNSERIKMALFSLGAEVHGQYAYERRFAEYWSALSKRLAGADTAAPRNVLASFLSTSKLRKLHNKLIMSLLERCFLTTASSSDVLESVPVSWYKRIKVLKAGRVAKAKGRQMNRISLAIVPKGAHWPEISYAPLAIETQASIPRNFPVSSHRSFRIPGAMAVDPFLRALGQAFGIKISENAAWLMVVALSEFVKTMLQNCMVAKQAIDSGTMPAGPFIRQRVLHRKRDIGDHSETRERAVRESGSNCITALDLHFVTSSVSLGHARSIGGSIARPSFERSLHALFATTVVLCGDPFDATKQAISSKLFRFNEPLVNKQGTASGKSGDGVEGRGRSPHHGGMGRGSKDLAALKARSSFSLKKAASGPLVDMSAGNASTLTPEASSPPDAGPSQATVSVETIEETSGESRSSPSMSAQSAGAIRRGKGFGVKNLAAMRARSVTLKPEEGGEDSSNSPLRSESESHTAASVAVAAAAVAALENAKEQAESQAELRAQAEEVHPSSPQALNESPDLQTLVPVSQNAPPTPLAASQQTERSQEDAGAEG